MKTEESDRAEGRLGEVSEAQVTKQRKRRGGLRIAQRQSLPDRQNPSMTAKVFQNIQRSLQHGLAGLYACLLSVLLPQGQIAVRDREAPPVSLVSPLQRSECKGFW